MFGCILPATGKNRRFQCPIPLPQKFSLFFVNPPSLFAASFDHITEAPVLHAFMRPVLMSAKDTNSSIQRFTNLWLENHDMLRAFVYMWVRDFHDAEDVIQEVASAAAGSFDQQDTSKPFGSWLIGIAKRRIADYYRMQNRIPLALSDQAMDELAEAQLDLAKSKDRRYDAMQVCLDRLSDRHRRAIDLRYGNDLSPEQIAKRVGASTTAVNAMIYRIRKALADCINDRMGNGA